MLNAVFEENAFHGFVSNAKKSQQYFFHKIDASRDFKKLFVGLVSKGRRGQVVSSTSNFIESLIVSPKFVEQLVSK